VIEQQGKVISVSAERARVRLGGQSGCPACDAGRGCGAGLFGKLLRRRPVLLDLENRVDARPNQAVTVGIPETYFLRLVSRLYLLPLLAVLFGAAAAHYLAWRLGSDAAGTDAWTLAGAIAGGVAAFFHGRRRAGEFPASFIVHILRISNSSNPNSGSRGINCE
jgi:sigma-E factor negative regulatory protein RseC